MNMPQHFKIIIRAIVIYFFFIACSFHDMNSKSELGLSEPSRMSSPLARPNIVLVMLDDLGVKALDVLLDLANQSEEVYRDLAPNLRKLQRVSADLKNSFVSTPLCCPSRSTFFSGLYAHNHKVTGNTLPQGGMKVFHDGGYEKSSIAVALQKSGYRTGYIGKYLNGYTKSYISNYAKDYQVSGVPPGWSSWQGLVDPTTYSMFDYVFNDNGRFVGPEGHHCPYANFSAQSNFDRSDSDNLELQKYIASDQCQDNYQTTQITKRAVAFISAQQSSDTKKPFFLYLTPAVPHSEGFPSLQIPDDEDLDLDSFIDAGGYREEFKDQRNEAQAKFATMIRPAPKYIGTLEDLPLPEGSDLENSTSFNEEDVSDKPQWVREKPRLDEEMKGNVDNQFRRALEATLSVDDLIGEIQNTISKLNIQDDTIIIFTSDNGFMYGDHRMSGKGYAYEEAARVPLLIKIPGVPGKPINNLVLNTDLAPTVLAFANADSIAPMDGRSLLPLIINENTNGIWRNQVLLEIDSGVVGQTYSGIRTQSGERVDPLEEDISNMLYIEYYDKNSTIISWEMYDLNTDQFQRDNLLNPDIINLEDLDPRQARLREKLYSLRNCNGVSSRSCQSAEDQ